MIEAESTRFVLLLNRRVGNHAAREGGRVSVLEGVGTDVSSHEHARDSFTATRRQSANVS